ncbi:MAG: hypothetical protein RSB41_02495 [Bacilli bacterium]
MRMYYAFSIRKDIYEQTKDNPKKLYHILESIYMMKSEDVVLGFKLFMRTAEEINKESINKVLNEINSDNINYTSFNNTHTINDFLRDENTKITVCSSHIKIKSNKDIPNILNDIKNIQNLFICDFINSDYFYLKDILLSV